jgi:SWI/SNF-related matrix-associated actin-dependent regulator 1 of chromatin subfamily A
LTKPYPYQSKGVRKIEHFKGRALLADDPGLGKTLQSLLWWNEYYDRRLGPAIVVCPAHLKYNWEREAWLHVRAATCVLEKAYPPSRGVPKSSLYIINYDILRNRQRGRKSWIELLRDMRPGLVILDECQKLRNQDSKQSKATKALCKGIPHVIGVSGTPLENRPKELFTVLNILRPEVYNSFFSFATNYCAPKKKPWGWDFNGASNLDKLHQDLNTYCMIRRRKIDVLEQLPEKIRSVIPIKLHNRAEYDKAVTNFLVWLRRNFGGKRADSAAKAERLAQLGYLKRLVALIKLPYVVNWIEDFLEDYSDQKLIVFGVHKSVVGGLFEYFSDKAVRVDGSVTGRDRQRAVDRFNNDKKCRLFFGNIQAAGTGWSASDCSNVLFAELGWTPGEHTQAEDRIHGIMRGKKGFGAMYYYLIAMNTIEEKLCTLIQKKQGTLDAVLDGRKIDDTLNIFDLLCESLQGTSSG